MAFLIEVVCNTDWKGRPDHKVKIVGSGTIKELIAKRDASIREMFINEIVEDEVITLESLTPIMPEAKIEKRAAVIKKELAALNDKKLAARWAVDGERWEMNWDKDEQRIFSWNDDGEHSSMSWTIHSGRPKGIAWWGSRRESG